MKEATSHSSDLVDKTGGGLFIIVCLTLGVFCRRVLKSTRVPYTVLLQLFGLLLGMMQADGNYGSLTDSIKSWIDINPHLFLYIFLPPLIYEGTNTVDYHVFKNTFLQMIMLAGPGVLIATGLTAWLVKNTFGYEDWGWNEYLTFGAMLSATDPVAVVSLLKELGASKSLAILIEGESLFNDGTAMVLFNLFSKSMEAGSRPLEPGAAVLRLARLTLGGPLLGYICGTISMLVLSKIVDDPTSEITLTVVACYGTFFLAEASPLDVSGVLAVVILGVCMSHFGRTSVSHVTEQFMHEFWELMGYVANTIIFVVSGSVMVGKYMSAGSLIQGRDFFYLLVLYVELHLVRVVVLLLLAPLLKKTGYGITRNKGLVIAWAGLRGAVGLALSLMIENNDLIGRNIRDKFLFHMSGIALLTLLINGTTTGMLLRYLKMDRKSFASKKMYETAVQHIEHRTEDAISTLKSDPFYTDADWALVWSYVPVLSQQALCTRKELHPDLSTDIESRSNLRVINSIEKNYLTKEDEENKPKLKRSSIRVRLKGSIGSRKFGSAQLNEIRVNIDPKKVEGYNKQTTKEEGQIRSVQELRQRIKREARHRFFNLLKACYWHQYETGFAGKHAIRVLVASVGKSEDESLKCKKLYTPVDEWKHLERICEVPKFLRRLYHVPILGSLLRHRTFQYVTVAFDVATSFIYAHRKVDEDFRQLIHSLQMHYDDDTLRLITRTVGADILAESERAQCSAQSVLDDIQMTFPEISRAVVTRQASYSIIEDMRQFASNLLKLGEIEEEEFEYISHALVKSRKKLLFHPPQMKLRKEIQILADIPAFRKLPEEGLHAVFKRAKEMVLNKGDILYKRGDRSTGFYIIIRGNVHLRTRPRNNARCSLKAVVHASTPRYGGTNSMPLTTSIKNEDSSMLANELPFANGDVIIDRIGRGRPVGCLSFLTETSQHTTVVCDSYVQAYFIDSHTLQYLYELDETSNVKEYLWQEAGAVAAMLYLNCYQDRTPTAIRRIIATSRLYEPPAGQDIVLEDCAILMRGSVVVARDSKETIKSITKLAKTNVELQFSANSILLILPKATIEFMGDRHNQMLKDIKNYVPSPKPRASIRASNIPAFGSAISPTKAAMYNQIFHRRSIGETGLKELEGCAIDLEPEIKLQPVPKRPVFKPPSPPRSAPPSPPPLQSPVQASKPPSNIEAISQVSSVDEAPAEKTANETNQEK